MVFSPDSFIQLQNFIHILINKLILTYLLRKMKNLIELILKIINNPKGKKHFEDISNILKNKQRNLEANVFEKCSKRRNINNNKQQ